MARVSLALRQSIKVLTRNLQDNPNLEGNVLKIQSERGVIETLFVNTAHELQVRARAKGGLQTV